MNPFMPKPGGPLKPGLGTANIGGGPAPSPRDKLATAIMNQGQGAAPAFGGASLPDAAPFPTPQPMTGAQPQQPRPPGGPQMRRPMQQPTMQRQQQFRPFGG